MPNLAPLSQIRRISSAAATAAAAAACTRHSRSPTPRHCRASSPSTALPRPAPLTAVSIQTRSRTLSPVIHRSVRTHTVRRTTALNHRGSRSTALRSGPVVGNGNRQPVDHQLGRLGVAQSQQSGRAEQQHHHDHGPDLCHVARKGGDEVDYQFGGCFEVALDVGFAAEPFGFVDRVSYRYVLLFYSLSQNLSLEGKSSRAVSRLLPLSLAPGHAGSTKRGGSDERKTEQSHGVTVRTRFGR